MNTRTATFNFRKFTAALAVALAVVSSVPAFAGSRASNAGLTARAQVLHSRVPQEGVSNDRAQALRECNALAAPIKDYAYGHTQNAIYRSCMAQHGQPE
jgi:hypothetical protein